MNSDGGVARTKRFKLNGDVVRRSDEDDAERMPMFTNEQVEFFLIEVVTCFNDAEVSTVDASIADCLFTCTATK